MKKGMGEVNKFLSMKGPSADLHVPETQGETDYYFKLLSDYGICLNPPQREAVCCIEGPVRIVAGAGSGKTTVLTSRIGYMIHEKKIEPRNILLLTYTKKASLEMIERLGRIPGITRTASQQVTAGTYHSLCLRILRANGNNKQVLSSERKRHFIFKMILKSLNLDEAYAPETVSSLIAAWKNHMITPSDLDTKNEIHQELKEVYFRYEDYKETGGMMDFEDMLIEAYQLLLHDELLLNYYQNQFQYILVDEFQDSSEVQYCLIKLLAEPNNNLCIVGDDAQTIYSYRAASSEFMLEFNKVYPNCKTILLDINYRSNQSIVGFANELIKYNKQIPKTLKVNHTDPSLIKFTRASSVEEEARLVVETIKEKQENGESFKEMAVLYRTHASGRAVFETLLANDIPFVTYGRTAESFYQNSFIKPVIALLKVSANLADDEAILEAAKLLYIKKETLSGVLEQINMSYDYKTPEDLFVQAINQIAFQKPTFQQNSLLRKRDTILKLKEMTDVAAVREICTGEIGYERQLELDKRKTLTIHKEMVSEILNELHISASRFNTIQDFLNFIQSVEEKNAEMEELRKRPDIEAVRLMTIHASKGLEFNTVMAIGWVEGILPHGHAISSKDKADTPLSQQEALEEERRLAYVCATRAKRNLYISAPNIHQDKESEVSRFLTEGFPSQVQEKMVL